MRLPLLMTWVHPVGLFELGAERGVIDAADSNLQFLKITLAVGEGVD